MLLSVVIGGPAAIRAARPERQQSSQQGHIAWVTDVLRRIQTVKVGMTRGDLLKIFGTEGGLSTGLHRTYVSRDCPYFKVDVEFEAVGRPSRDGARRITLVEDNRDVIVKISKPYLQFTTID
jgi:hypothetical protein